MDSPEVPNVFNNYGMFLKSGGTGGRTFLDNYTTFNNFRHWWMSSRPVC